MVLNLVGSGLFYSSQERRGAKEANQVVVSLITIVSYADYIYLVQDRKKVLFFLLFFPTLNQ